MMRINEKDKISFPMVGEQVTHTELITGNSFSDQHFPIIDG